MPPPPPTGQYTDLGVPIIFYVRPPFSLSPFRVTSDTDVEVRGQVTALFDYAAPNAEEFSFSMGDVIAVTETEVRFFLLLLSSPSEVLTSWRGHA